MPEVNETEQSFFERVRFHGGLPHRLRHQVGTIAFDNLAASEHTERGKYLEVGLNAGFTAAIRSGNGQSDWRRWVDMGHGEWIS